MKRPLPSAPFLSSLVPVAFLLVACAAQSPPAERSQMVTAQNATGAPCSRDADCPAIEATCRVNVCRAGHCSEEKALPGTTPPSAQVSGDCKRRVCGPGGEIIERDDLTNAPPSDNDSCMRSLCVQGAATRAPARAGTNCGGGGTCDGSGVCLGVVDIAVGRYHGCARLSDASLKCWGSNERGQLGDGGDEPRQSEAVPVPGLQHVAEVALGGTHTCARIDRGQVFCWGNNENGQLGNATDTDAPFPSPVTSLGTAKQLSLGLIHTCALLDDGTVRCWGANQNYQLGTNAEESSALPITVPKLKSVKQISAGGVHTCALLANGSIWCWGANDLGQLGDNTLVSRPLPKAVLGIKRAAQVASGRLHTCARLDDGTVWCWGANEDGQLGDGTTDQRSVAAQVSLPSKAIDLASGNGHTCARLDDRRMYCWGWNRSGQLGDGRNDDATLPHVVTTLSGPVLQMSLGSKHTCALDASSKIVCWGDNSQGQLGIPPEEPLSPDETDL